MSRSNRLIPVILVVEDSADTRHVMSVTLRTKGYTVVSATNGEEAVETARRDRPDLIIMDLNMPQLDGLGAAQQIRAQDELKGTPILAITAYDTYGMKEAAIEAGCDGYIVKPIEFDHLDKIIGRLLVADDQDSGQVTA